MPSEVELAQSRIDTADKGMSWRNSLLRTDGQLQLLFTKLTVACSLINMYSIPYRQRRGYESTCAATGTICRNRPIILTMDGQSVSSLYCQFHACRQIEGGRACLIAKLPRAMVCSQRELALTLRTKNEWLIDVKTFDAKQSIMGRGVVWM